MMGQLARADWGTPYRKPASHWPVFFVLGQFTASMSAMAGMGNEA